MNIKNILSVVGLLTGLITLDSASAHANQANQEIQYEYRRVSIGRIVTSSKYSNTFQYEVDKAVEDNKKRINMEAIEICSGREVSVDASSIKSDLTFNDYTKLYFVSTTAMVFCIN